MSSDPRCALLWACALAASACGREDIELARPIEGIDVSDTPDDCGAAVPSDLLMSRPPMGWNGYNAFEDCSPELNEAKLHAVVDALVASGLQSAGYQYVNLDKCSQVASQDDGSPALDPALFPSGMEALSAYVHERGLSFGVFSATRECQGVSGGDGREAMDVATLAAWGVDYLKYNSCSPGDPAEAALQQAMSAAVSRSPRPIVFSITDPPFAEWMPETAQLWRTGANAAPSWDWLVGAVDDAMRSTAYARAGAFNDPDMLEVGNGDLTEGEARAHFSIWSILAAPLLAGNDLSSMSEATRAVLTNGDVIALDQDPLALQGALVHREGSVDVLAKPLAECGARGVVLWNRGTKSADVALTWPQIWLEPAAATARDLWAQQDLPAGANGLTVSVPGHEALALRVIGREPPLPTGEVYLSDLSWTYVVNGLGPVERDASNGEALEGDGKPLRLRGGVYDKGLGMHGPALIRYRLGRACTRFTADVGIDDESAGKGTAQFEVWADGSRLFESGLVTGSTPARRVDVDLSGKRELRLFVGVGGDNYDFDHADWAGARLTCRKLVTPAH
jgi:alpha-galactosidase